MSGRLTAGKFAIYSLRAHKKQYRALTAGIALGGMCVPNFVLGPLLEENLRRAMILSRGDPTTFVTRPISAVLLLIAALVLVVVFLPSIKAKREADFQEED